MGCKSSTADSCGVSSVVSSSAEPMEGEPAFKYSYADFLLTFGGLLFFLVDIALDTWAVVDFYQEEAYVHLGLLLLFLLGSSAVAQVYSWLWYHYDNYQTQTRVENCLNPLSLKLLHVFQLGVYFRYAGIVEVAILSFTTKRRAPRDVAAYLTHDLSMLRLIETFTESAPQLVLMLTVILQRGLLDHVTVLKAVGSASAIACSLTTYHRSLRSFLPDKHQQKLSSSLVYFLWNLLLIMPRIAALALFASVLPCYIFTHFVCSWMMFFFCAWRLKTTFMDSPGGEWLFRATIGLIWYFSWFNVAEGKTRYKLLVYHFYIVVDICVLCGLWCWQIYSKAPDFALITSFVIIALYIIGLLLKVIYYKFCHPKIDERECKESVESVETDGQELEVVVHSSDVGFRSMPSPPEPVQKRENRRMRKLAENFYS